MKDREILASILKCGTADIARLNEIIDAVEKFLPENVDYMDQALDNIHRNGEDLDFCNLVYELFTQMIEQIITQVSKDLNQNLDFYDFEIDPNYMCSSIAYIGTDEKVTDWLNEHCPIIVTDC